MAYPIPPKKQQQNPKNQNKNFPYFGTKIIQNTPIFGLLERSSKIFQN
jgi:hypothetical protein